MSYTLAFAVSLLAWALILASPARAADPAISLPGGTVAALLGSDLRFELVEVTDARCPSDLACVWEGTIRLVLQVGQGGAAEQTIVVCNACEDGSRTAHAAGYRFDFVGLEPDVRVIEALGRKATVADYTGVVQITALPRDAGKGDATGGRAMRGWVSAIVGAGLAMGLAVGLAGPGVAQTARLLLPGGQDVALPVGALSGVSDVAAPGLVLTLTQVQDQRCPSQVDCYWEGMIRAVISVNPGTDDARTFVLCNQCDDGDREAVVAGYLLTLDHLEPAVPAIEQLGRAAVLADYSVTVIVSAAP